MLAPSSPDQDIYNVFNPMEYVGYEDEARSHHCGSDSISGRSPTMEMQKLEKKYRIYIKEDDSKGIDVEHSFPI